MRYDPGCNEWLDLVQGTGLTNPLSSKCRCFVRLILLPHQSSTINHQPSSSRYFSLGTLRISTLLSKADQVERTGEWLLPSYFKLLPTTLSYCHMSRRRKARINLPGTDPRCRNSSKTPVVLPNQIIRGPPLN